MQSLIDRYGKLRLKRRPAFVALSRSIVAQQISTKAADTIRRRLEAHFGRSASSFVTAEISTLRRFGISEAKANCLLRVASHAVAGNFDDLDSLPDEVVIERLRTIKGIGPWTAEMFLIFSLARPDVWPVSDTGLRAAVRRLYGTEALTAVRRVGARFAPQRSVAALYLWRSLENSC